ncbi:MAG TPA: TetR/AcrR family transcriptional regulator [Mycobacterium sp.]|jgi:AcrR family transcriptional regulator|uniref:TetR/AcrR family transcriptional regulator n=1 Tax=Mycobacterium sp. TaxID=1785 RepID=UPI002D732E4A|nr:TetR/AcrR family transcriptional regulator [Mycobacterium sp.]HZU50176.1 TetR/AcrR family transcriptional regulator [Mycobacterium sp.]
MGAAQETRSRIVDACVQQASVGGLEGLTIGSLATRLGMSKAGVIGPFGSKEKLQIATLERAVSLFRQQVIEAARAKPAGMPRLNEVIQRWTSYLESGPFPNGCFVTAASCELDGRPGVLRDRLRDMIRLWQDFLRAEIEVAQRQGSIPRTLVPEDVVFVWTGVIMAANQEIQLMGSTGAVSRARRLMRAAIQAE